MLEKPPSALDVHVNEENYFSVKAAQNINAGDIITEFGGDVELINTLLAMGVPPI